MSRLRLQDKVAIIVGAGQQPGGSVGNGRATAERFAQEGASLLLVDIQPDWLADTLAAVTPYGHPVASLLADITQEDSCKHIIQSCVERYGRIDILHNNVGIVAVGGPVEQSEADWDRVIDVNLKSMFLTCKHVLPVMLLFLLVLPLL